MEALLEEVIPSRILAVVGAPGVGKSTRFPLTLVQKVRRKVIVVTPTAIGARVLTQFVQPSIRTDVVGTLEYWDLNSYYNSLLRKDQKAEADIVCIDDAQLTKLEQTLLFLVLLQRSTQSGMLVMLLGIVIPKIYTALAEREFSELQFTGTTFPVVTAYLETDPSGEDKINACLRELSVLLPVRAGSALLIVRSHDVGNYSSALRERFPTETIYTVTSDNYDAAIFTERRSIIVSTPILETTVTIPDLEIVVDSMEMDMPRTRSNGSIVTGRKSWISAIQAAQRQGRVGRTKPGTCLRLCTSEFFQSLPRQYPVEIELVDLSVAQLKLHLHGLADILPKHLDSRNQLLVLRLLEPDSRPVAEFITRLPLGLVPGYLATQWLSDAKNLVAEEISAMILYLSLVEVEGPYIGVPITLPHERISHIQKWAAPSDFHVLLRIVEDVDPLQERWINPQGLLYGDNWREVRHLMSGLRYQLQQEGYSPSPDLDLYTYLPKFQAVCRKALPMAIYSYADDLGQWIQAKGDRSYSPNAIYPEKDRSPVQVALAILADVIILGVGLD